MSNSGNSLILSVMVPSYRRPEHLLKCLVGLQENTRLPEQVVVVLRDVDKASRERLGQWCAANNLGQCVDVAIVTEPGQIAAMNRGLEVATGDVVCFTDDDCIPRPEWLQRLAIHYADPSIGGVGGRDVVHHGDQQVPTRQCSVGKVTWAGKIIGNHHCAAISEPVEVDHLKGANMSFRRALMTGFDENLAVGPHFNDTEASLSVGEQGFRLIYDPGAMVDHYPAPRFDAFGRRLDSPELAASDSHNWVYCMLKHLPGLRKVVFLVSAFLVGMGNRYGLLKYLLSLPRGPIAATRLFVASTVGKLKGLHTYRTVRQTAMGSTVSSRKRGQTDEAT